MGNDYPRFVTRAAIEGLVEKLNLPAPGAFDQDWEYVVSDFSRVGEFLNAYDGMGLNVEEKFALMIVILSSLDDAIRTNNELKTDFGTIQHLLLRDYEIHLNTIIYWSLQGEPWDDCFAVTPFVREVAGLLNINLEPDKNIFE